MLILVQLDEDIHPSHPTVGHLNRAYGKVNDAYIDEHAFPVSPSQSLKEMAGSPHIVVFCASRLFLHVSSGSYIRHGILLA